MSSIPNIHVDEVGNIRKGPPLPLPTVISGALAYTGNTPYLNMVGNESQIQTPPSGRNILANPAAMHHAGAHLDVVDNGSHFGHILNDYNGELDDRETMGTTQIPAQALFNHSFASHQADSLFTSSLPPPGGARPANAAAAHPGAPRAPGGGVAPKEGMYHYKNDNEMEKRLRRKSEGGGSLSMYDESLPGAENRRGFSEAASLQKARLLAGAGVGNTLEMVNNQQQKVLTREKRRDTNAGKGRKKKIPKSFRGISKKTRR